MQRSRTSDPASSHAAAAYVADTGVARTQQCRVLAALKQCPHRTSNELAVECGMERHMVAKRLPELLKRGRVAVSTPKRRDQHTNRWAVTWRPA